MFSRGSKGVVFSTGAKWGAQSAKSVSFISTVKASPSQYPYPPRIRRPALTEGIPISEG